MRSERPWPRRARGLRIWTPISRASGSSSSWGGRPCPVGWASAAGVRGPLFAQSLREPGSDAGDSVSRSLSPAATWSWSEHGGCGARSPPCSGPSLHARCWVDAEGCPQGQLRQGELRAAGPRRGDGLRLTDGLPGARHTPPTPPSWGPRPDLPRAQRSGHARHRDKAGPARPTKAGSPEARRWTGHQLRGVLPAAPGASSQTPPQGAFPFASLRGPCRPRHYVLAPATWARAPATPNTPGPPSLCL